ncbi:MAG TPA: hypothetical protein VF172_13625 [Nitrososphaera sp.]
MGSAKGSRLFASDGENIAKLLTIALLSLGVIAASLFTYQQLAKPVTPNLFSKDAAIQIAFKAGKWDTEWNEQKATGDMQISSTLVHVQANGFSLKVDEKTLQDIPVAGSRLEGYENQYIWIVNIFAPDNYGNRSTDSWINAETGEILMQYPS